MTNVQCYSCKGFGHNATNCTKKFCNYCKKTGHIITQIVPFDLHRNLKLPTVPRLVP